MAGVLDLCGPRVYTIVETAPQAFVSIVASATNEYLSNWTLLMNSINIADVGTCTVTLQAKLLNYSGVLAPTKAFTLTVLDPCIGTAI